MAKHFDAWKSRADVKTITLDSALCPVILVGPVSPTTDELEACYQKEIASGYTPEVATLAANRRVRKVNLWTGPNGLSLGVKPTNAIMNGDLDWWTTLLRAIPEGQSTRLFQPERVTGRVGAMESLNSIGGLGPLVKRLMGDEDVVALSTSVISVTNGRGGTAGYGAALKSEASLSEGQIAVYVRYRYTYSGTDQTRIYRVVVAKPSGRYQGIRGLYYSQAHFGSSVHERSIANGGWHLVGVSGLSGWPAIISAALGSNRVAEQDREYSYDYGDPDYTSLALISYFPVATSTVRLKSPWGNDASDALTAAGLTLSQVYAFGNPEFSARFTVLGTVTSTDTGLNVVDARLCLNWWGGHLAKMSTSLSPTEIAGLEDLQVATYIPKVKDCFVADLEKLELQKVYRENDETIEDMNLVEATAENEAITFKMAVARAATVDRSIWHGLRPRISSVEPDYILVSGSDLAWTVEGYQGGEALLLTSAQCETFVSQGVPFIVGYETATDMCTVIFGSSYSTLREAGRSQRGMEDLDEGKVYGPETSLLGDVPDTSRLNDSQRTAMLMLGSALNRAHLSSFAIGCFVIANNARKRLF